jgi:hypothetical protein
MGHSSQYPYCIRQTIAAAALSVTVLAISNGPAPAQHRGTLGSATIGAQNRLSNTDGRDSLFFDRKHQGLLSAFPMVIAAPYWGSYGPDIGPDYAGTQADANSVPSEYSSKPRWDENNHSPVIEQRSHVTEQPSAKLMTIPASQDSDQHRAWLKRCEPRLVFDDYGVQRYQYNGKRGCEFGQWSE